MPTPVYSYSLVSLVSGLLVFMLGFFVWLKKPRSRLHILFFLDNIAIAAWLAGTLFFHRASLDADKLWWAKFIYVGVNFIPIFLYHFGLIFCQAFRRQRIWLYAGYLSAAIFLFLIIWSDKFITPVIYRSGRVGNVLAGPYHDLFLVYVVLFFNLFIYNLWRRYKASPPGHKKREIWLMLCGYGLMDIIGPLAFLPVYGVPIHPIVFLAAVPFAAILAYAMIRYQLFSVKLVAAEAVTVTISLLLIIFILTPVVNSPNLEDSALRFLISAAVAFFAVFSVRTVRSDLRRRQEVIVLAHSLRKANFHLRELNREKTDFLSMATHQLRTPLTIVNGYIELIKDGGYGPVSEEIKTILTNMDDSNGRLIKLVDDFLDVTRLEQGRTKLNIDNQDLLPIIDSAVAEIMPRAKAKQLDLVWHRPEHPIVLGLDDEKIRHVIFNYIDNAIKYTDRGDINIFVAREHGGITVSVVDKGVGFGEVDKDKFFHKFYRGENVKTNSAGGTGIGLFVCKKFIEAHNGRVWAKSAGVGKGSEFGFWIPA